MHSAVNFFLYESGVVGKRMFVSVFKDEITVRVQQAAFEHLVRNVLQAIKGLGRIGKYDVELFLAYRKEVKDVAVHGSDIAQAESRRLLSYESGIVPVHLYAVHSRSTSGCKLVGNCSRTPEQIENLKVLKLIFIVQNIEKGFLGKVSGRPCRIVRWKNDCPALQGTANDSHTIWNWKAEYRQT